MSTAAIVTMLLGMAAIWGGLTASVVLTVRRSRRRVIRGAPHRRTGADPSTEDPR